MSQSLVPPMPACGECRAPQFDPAKLHRLHHFFNDLSFQFTQVQVVDEAEMKGHALHFVNYDTAELWKILPEFANVTEGLLTLCASCTQAPMWSNAG